MELADLRVFVAVAEAGGIIKAAERLHRVPSNVTTRIQKLESELGVALLIRDRKRVRLSPKGEHLLVYARQLLALAEEASDSLNQSAPSGDLNVGCMEAVAASRLAPYLSEFHQQYPDVSLRLSTNPTGILIEQVIEGELDLAFVADPQPDKRLESQPVFQERLVLVSDTSLDSLQDYADLSKELVLLGFSAQCAYRQRLLEWAKRSDQYARFIEIQSYHALLGCVAGGMGLGIVPQVLLEQYPFNNEIRVHSLPDDLAETHTHLVWRKDSLKSSMSAFGALF